MGQSDHQSAYQSILIRQFDASFVNTFVTPLEISDPADVCLEDLL